MKAASLKEIKHELSRLSSEDLTDIVIRLSRFKKENKELLSYLLYEVDNEDSYIQSIKREVDAQFEEINQNSYYFIKKSVRKILRNINKYIRYSKKKETEVALHLYLCSKLASFEPSIEYNLVLQNLYMRQYRSIEKSISALHEDLQYDYQLELDKLPLY